MKYTIAIAALLGMVAAEELYDAPVNATAFTEKKAVKESGASDEDSDEDAQASDDSSDDVQASEDSSDDVQLDKKDDSSEDVQASEDSDDDVQASEDSDDDDVQASDDSSDAVQASADSSDDVQASADSSDDVQASDDSSDDVQASDDSSDDVQADDDSSDDLQLAGDESSDHSGEFFEAREHGTGPLDKKYERVVPTNFADGGDDLFMRSMIKTYALEGKNKDGSPNGQFFMDEATTRAATGEVLETHKNLKGGAKQDYLKTYFPRTWAHFDVNKTGKVGVEVMPQFMRFIASDQTMSL